MDDDQLLARVRSGGLAGKSTRPDDDPIQQALGARIGDDVAEALLARMNSYSNYPNAVKGTAKRAGAPEIESAALALVEDATLAADLGLDSDPETGAGAYPTMECWALLTLAARADVEVVDRMADLLSDEAYARKLLATIRRAATKHAAAETDAAGQAPTAAEQAASSAPQKVSEVKPWLAAHPDPDPALLAPHAGQKPAARVAAVRVLGVLGTPRALEVLGQYATDRHPGAVLAELHRAWGRFDRRAFAATMFRTNAYTLDLGAAPTLEGIGAVPGLTSLDVVLAGGADLSPLAECAELRTLRVRAMNPPGPLGLEPLLELPELDGLQLPGLTGDADLEPLAALGVRRLELDLDGADGSVLLRMPRLESVVLSDSAERPAVAGLAIALARQGVRVMAYTHQQWVTGLIEQAAEAAYLFTTVANGYVGITNDASAAEKMGRYLGSSMHV